VNAPLTAVFSILARSSRRTPPASHDQRSSGEQDARAEGERLRKRAANNRLCLL
jgi:hypothetical protein